MQSGKLPQQKPRPKRTQHEQNQRQQALLLPPPLKRGFQHAPSDAEERRRYEQLAAAQLTGTDARVEEASAVPSSSADVAAYQAADEDAQDQDASDLPGGPGFQEDWCAALSDALGLVVCVSSIV